MVRSSTGFKLGRVKRMDLSRTRNAISKHSFPDFVIGVTQPKTDLNPLVVFDTAEAML